MGVLYKIMPPSIKSSAARPRATTSRRAGAARQRQAKPAQAAIEPSTPASPPTVTLGESAYQQLKQMLMQGAFTPGEAIPVRAVSEALGIGATPVREALQRLAAEGVLEGSANMGVRTARLERSELQTLYETRMLLEGEAAALAARRITAAELLEIEETFRRVVAAADQGDAAACLSANMTFHFRIYAASRLPLLVRCIEQMWLRIGPVLMERARSRPLTARNFFGSSRAAHERLLKALKRHDAKEARDGVRQLLYVGYDAEGRS